MIDNRPRSKQLPFRHLLPAQIDSASLDLVMAMNCKLETNMLVEKMATCSVMKKDEDEFDFEVAELTIVGSAASVHVFNESF